MAPPFIRRFRAIDARRTTCAAVVLSWFFACGCAGLARTIDVRDHGAACDGITDDGPALQQAFDALQDGDTLEIPCMLGVGGSGVLLADRSRVTILAAAEGAGIRALAAPNGGFEGFGPVLLTVRRCSSCEIAGLIFDGNSTDVIPLGLDHCESTTVRDNTIRDVGSVGGGALVSVSGHSNRYLGNTIRNTAGAPDGADYGSGATRGMWLGNEPAAMFRSTGFLLSKGLRWDTIRC